MSKMEKIIEKMAECVCDRICKYRADNGLDQERLDEICAECEIGDHVCNVLNEYERVSGGGAECSKNLWTDRMMSRFMRVN